MVKETLNEMAIKAIFHNHQLGFRLNIYELIFNNIK